MAVSAADRGSPARPYQLFMLALCLYALSVLAAEALVPMSARTRDVLTIADTAVCVVFFADFLVCLYRAPSRRRYLITWGWLDLLSSMPTLPLLRIGRVGRVVRLIRVIRGFRATRTIAAFVLERRADAVFLASGLVTLLILVFSSIAVLHFESGANATIRTPEDAVWWSAVTMATVGYGDKYPVTLEGRLIGILLITTGVGLFGTFAGFVASWFTRPTGSRSLTELEALRDEVRELRRTIVDLKERHVPSDRA